MIFTYTSLKGASTVYNLTEVVSLRKEKAVTVLALHAIL